MVKFLQDYEYIQTFCYCSTRHDSTLNQSHCLLSCEFQYSTHYTYPIFCYLSMSYVHGKILTPGQLGHFMCLLYAYTPKAMSYIVELFINIFRIIELCNRWGIHNQVILQSGSGLKTLMLVVEMSYMYCILWWAILGI